MEVAKISDKGQTAVSASVRNKLRTENSAMLAFKRAEEAFAGEAKKAGFETEEDIQAYMREIREDIDA